MSKIREAQEKDEKYFAKIFIGIVPESKVREKGRGPL